jgi:hypothetical protein
LKNALVCSCRADFIFLWLRGSRSQRNGLFDLGNGECSLNKIEDGSVLITGVSVPIGARVITVRAARARMQMPMLKCIPGLLPRRHNESSLISVKGGDFGVMKSFM